MRRIGCMMPLPTGCGHVCSRRVKRLGNPMVIYCIDKGRKLYLRRLIGQLPLWHPDRAVALQLDADQVQQVVGKLRQSPAPKPAPTSPLPYAPGVCHATGAPTVSRSVHEGLSQPTVTGRSTSEIGSPDPPIGARYRVAR
jgi:hypothetical protein